MCYLRMVIYNEYKVSPSLSRYVECYWTLQGHAFHAQHHVFPDGCMDILFDFGDVVQPGNPFRVVTDSDRIQIIGSMTKPVPVVQHGKIDLLGVRFKPGGLFQFVKFNGKALTDQAVNFSTIDLLPDSWKVEKLINLTTRERIAVLQEYFCSKLRMAKPTAIERAIEVIVASKGMCKIESLCFDVGLSPKTFYRKLNEQVGLSPKQLNQVIRFRAVKEVLEHNHFNSLTELAWQFQFTDPAHFSHSFKSMAGMTPSEFVGRNR